MTPKRLLVLLPCAALLAACTTDDAPPLDATPTTPAISTTPLTSTPAAVPAVPAAPDTEEADSNGEDWMVGALRDFERQNSGQSFPTEVVPYYEGDPLNEARADLAIRNCDQYMRSFHDSYRLTPQYDVPGDPSSIRQPEIISLVHHQDQRIELIVRAYMMSGDRPWRHRPPAWPPPPTTRPPSTSSSTPDHCRNDHASHERQTGLSPQPGREPEVAELNYLQGHMIEATLHFPAYNVFGTPVKNVSRCLATPMNDDATQHWVEHYGKLNLDLNSLGR